MQQMALHDIDQGHGVAVLDPQGGLVEDLLRTIPRRHLDRVVYLNSSDPAWVPIWNPLRVDAGVPHQSVADAIARALCPAMVSFGDLPEHMFSQAVRGILDLGDGTLLDVHNLLMPDTPEGQRLRQRVLGVVQDPVAGAFWQGQFQRYHVSGFVAVRAILLRLLRHGTIGGMLAQPDSAFSFREVIDQGRILLVDLSGAFGDGGALGSLILSMLHLAAVSRDHGNGTQAPPFHIYCDDVHHIAGIALDHLIVEARRSRVSLTVAHQWLDQLSPSRLAALSTAGSTIIFRVGQEDTRQLRENLQGRVEFDDLTELKRFQAIVRIGDQVARIKTPELRSPPAGHARDLIVEASHRRYYRLAAELNNG
jgi:hypothetical protein